MSTEKTTTVVASWVEGVNEECPTCGSIRRLNMLALSDSRTQAFFANLADGVKAPNVDERYRDFVADLLKRATEAGLYA